MKKCYWILLICLIGMSFVLVLRKEVWFPSGDAQAIEPRHSLVQWTDEEILHRFKENHDTLDFHFIDVGQGDSTLIVSDSGQAILIDGGTPDQGNKVIQYLKEEGINCLEWVIATHPDIDHIGGLIPVIEELKVKNVLDSGKTHTTNTYEEYRKIIKEKDIPLFTAEKGEELPTDMAEIIILNAHKDGDTRNESSIVLHVSDGKSSVLLTGDATIKNEKNMRESRDIQSDVLKVAHHGSPTSTSDEFIKAVNPEVAILPYDNENEYGHPNAGVVKRLREHGMKLYSTEKSGDIQVVLYEGKIYMTAKPWEGRGRIRAPLASLFYHEEISPNFKKRLFI